MNKYFVLSLLVFFGSSYAADLNRRIVQFNATKGCTVSSLFTKEVVESKIPSVVLFSAPWCGPCTQFKPTYEQLALSYPENKVKFVYVNIDDLPQKGHEYGVKSVPTIKYFKDGKDLGRSETDRTMGNLKKEIKTKLGV